MTTLPFNDPGARSWYVNDHVDEGDVPATTLDGWATYLADWQDDSTAEYYPDGEAFEASAILWHADIIATRTTDGWKLDREPVDGDFVAVRYGEGLGWAPENIVYPNGQYDVDAGEYRNDETMAQALVNWLTENDHLCDDVEYVAHGKHESGWAITLRRTDPPTVTTERKH